MPAKGVGKISRAKKTSIAKGKALGKPRKQIAAEVGVSETTVAHYGDKPEERARIEKFGDIYEAKQETLYAEALESCRKDLTGGKASERATARAQAVALIQAGDKYRRPPAEAEDASQGQYTLTELLVSFHKQQIQGGDG